MLAYLCRLLCKRAILKSDVILADILLLKFCERVQSLYGKEAITHNMHMHILIRLIKLVISQEYFKLNIPNFVHGLKNG